MGRGHNTQFGGYKQRRNSVHLVGKLVVITGPFINFLLHNHFITEKKIKKKPGDVNDEANFSLFILLHKRKARCGQGMVKVEAETSSVETSLARDAESENPFKKD
jgi:hypothetical protein